MWVLSLASGAWACLPGIGHGLHGLSVSALLSPTKARSASPEGLLILGTVDLGRGGVGEVSAAHTPSCAMVPHDKGRGLCLALCALERQVRDQVSQSQSKTQNPAVDGSEIGGGASISKAVTQGIAATPQTGEATARRLTMSSPTSPSVSATLSAAGSGCFSGNPWSRRYQPLAHAHGSTPVWHVKSACGERCVYRASSCPRLGRPRTRVRARNRNDDERPLTLTRAAAKLRVSAGWKSLAKLQGHPMTCPRCCRRTAGSMCGPFLVSSSRLIRWRLSSPALLRLPAVSIARPCTAK